MGEGKTTKFRYAGSTRQYLRRALVNTCMAAGLCLVLFLFVFILDRTLLGMGYVQSLHLAALVLLVVVWGLLLVRMALAFGRFEIDVDTDGLTVRRSGRSDYILFDKIESVDTVNRPMWWAMRADMKPLAQSSRGMIRIHRQDKPPLTFAGGLEREDELLKILERRSPEFRIKT